MLETAIKTRMQAGEAVVGVLATQADAALAETVALLGFDFFMLDAEHGPTGPRDAEAVVLACERRGVTSLARVGTKDEKTLLQYLDAGLQGVMMPGITSPDEVRQLVAAVKYPPLGARGLGPVRAADFMLGERSQADYVAFANAQTLVLPQIEDAACLDRLDEMLAVEGVDGFVVGPRDLALSMGFTDGPGHPEVQAAIERIYDAVLGSGKILGTVAGSGDAAHGLVERGVRFVLTSLTALLKPSSKAFLDGMRAEVASA